MEKRLTLLCFVYIVWLKHILGLLKFFWIEDCLVGSSGQRFTVTALYPLGYKTGREEKHGFPHLGEREKGAAASRG